MNILSALLPIISIIFEMIKRSMDKQDDEKLIAIAKNDLIHELFQRQAKDILLARRIKGVDGEPRTVTKEDRDWLRNL